MTTTAETTTQSRVLVLAEMVRLSVAYSLPAPHDIRFSGTYLNLVFDATADLDAWANHLEVTPKPVVDEQDGVAFSWQYRAERRDWNGYLVGLAVCHLVPTVDELVSQPAGAEVA